jgi:hypothetical protein
MNDIDFLLNNQDIDTKFPNDYKNINILNINIDKEYIKFMSNHGGGYFFNKSLLIYTNAKSSCSWDEINRNMHHEYNIISDNIFCFACDIFGNQFYFDLYSGNIYFLNIESGEKEFMAKDFLDWISKIKSQTDYYTGRPFIQEWENVTVQLKWDERLTAKFPFILGGEYDIDNFRVEKLEKIIEFNAMIARQINDLPDGTSINIKVV